MVNQTDSVTVIERLIQWTG